MLLHSKGHKLLIDFSRLSTVHLSSKIHAYSSVRNKQQISQWNFATVHLQTDFTRH